MKSYAIYITGVILLLTKPETTVSLSTGNIQTSYFLVYCILKIHSLTSELSNITVGHRLLSTMNYKILLPLLQHQLLLARLK